MDRRESPRELSIQLSLIGGFELRHGGTLVAVPPSSERLMAFVALQEGPVRRRRVGGALWIDASEERAGANLRSALWRTPSPGGCPVVVSSATHLWFNPEIEVDFWVGMAWARSMLSDEVAALTGAELLRRGLVLLSEDLLPDWPEDWVLVERERFRQRRLHALESMSENLTDAGLYCDALEAGLAAVAAEPLRESGHRQVVRIHLREGNLSEAIREYESYARMLAEELGVSPSPAMQDLIRGAAADLALVPG
jgi:DNA-binding SARP family transcriptional activator